jgi:hypothetical protein
MLNSIDAVIEVETGYTDDWKSIRFSIKRSW